MECLLRVSDPRDLLPALYGPEPREDLLDDGAPKPLPLLTLEQLRARSLNVRWLVKHAIPAESVGMIFGASQTFKSFIAIDMAMHVAHGMPWLGHRVAQGPVIIIAGEGGAALFRRIHAWHRVNRKEWGSAPVHVVTAGLDLAADSSRVVEAAAALGVVPALVVIDTLSQTFSGDENSAREVAGYLQQIGNWFRNTWLCAVAIVHHTGHQQSERPRGSTALTSNLDFQYGVFRDEKEMLATMTCTKLKDGELHAPVSFSLAVHELGRDEDGDSISSLVASRITTCDEMLERMQSEAQKGRGGRNQLLVQYLQNGMPEADLRSLFCGHVEGDAQTKRQAYFRAKKWAIDQRLIDVAEGFVIVLQGA